MPRAQLYGCVRRMVCSALQRSCCFPLEGSSWTRPQVTTPQAHPHRLALQRARKHQKDTRSRKQVTVNCGYICIKQFCVTALFVRRRPTQGQISGVRDSHPLQLNCDGTSGEQCLALAFHQYGHVQGRSHRLWGTGVAGSPSGCAVFEPCALARLR